jgi:phosphoribosylanthranilate isomerase
VERFHVDFHLLDARAKAKARQGLRGGTGEAFDWALLARRRSKVPLILSGGLRADNVMEAIAQTTPYAVDTASGTESAPGRKDPQKLHAFFASVERSAVPDQATGHPATHGAETISAVDIAPAQGPAPVGGAGA